MTRQTVPMTAHARASAPGQYLGYGLQPVRLCFHLLNADRSGTASIEHLDDVALKTSDNRVLLEQTKSALKQNPISDWSEDLWKTFANWLDTINSGFVDPGSTRFQLYVTPIKPGHLGKIGLSETNFPHDVERLISDLQTAVAKRSRPPRCHSYLRQLLDADRSTVTDLIVNFRLKSDTDPIDPIRRILRLSVQDELLDNCCAHAIGLAKQQSDSLIRAGRPAMIDVKTFHREVRASISKNNLARMLPSFATNPTPKVIDETLGDRPMFVRQLNIVNMPTPIVLNAISAYLQNSFPTRQIGQRKDWSSTKAYWSSIGLSCNVISCKSWRSTICTNPLSPSKQGRLLYNRCVTTTANLDGREVPTHFVPGCYNALADSLDVGWHPWFASTLDPEVD